MVRKNKKKNKNKKGRSKGEFNRAEKSTPSKDTLNFNFLAQFGGELCEEKTQKIRKTKQKTIFLRLWGGVMRLKSRNSQKAHLWLSPSSYIKFQLVSSIRKGNWTKIALSQGQKYKNFLYLSSQFT